LQHLIQRSGQRRGEGDPRRDGQRSRYDDRPRGHRRRAGGDPDGATGGFDRVHRVIQVHRGRIEGGGEPGGELLRPTGDAVGLVGAQEGRHVEVRGKADELARRDLSRLGAQLEAHLLAEDPAGVGVWHLLPQPTLRGLVTQILRHTQPLSSVDERGARRRRQRRQVPGVPPRYTIGAYVQVLAGLADVHQVQPQLVHELPHRGVVTPDPLRTQLDRAASGKHDVAHPAADPLGRLQNDHGPPTLVQPPGRQACSDNGDLDVHQVFRAGPTPRSPGSPVVVLLAQLHVDEHLRAAHPGHGPNASPDEFEQVVVVLAHGLDEQVEAAGGDHHVVDLDHLRQLVGHRDDVAVDADADHGLPAEPELVRVRDGHDLDHACLLQAGHALPDRRLGQAHGARDRRVRPAPVLLQLLHDRLADIVEKGMGDGDGHGPSVGEGGWAEKCVPSRAAAGNTDFIAVQCITLEKRRLLAYAAFGSDRSPEVT
jgi:hypothetical protein